MTQFNKINQSVCFQCLQLQSVLIFLASTYLVIRTHFCGGGTDRAEFGNLEIRVGIRTVVNKEDELIGAGLTGVGYGDGGVGILHIVELSKCADCIT